MKNWKFLIILLFVLITFFLSAGGVFAEDNMTDTISVSSCDEVNVSSNVDESVLADTLYVNNTLKSNDDLGADFTADKNIGSNSLTVSFNDTSDGNVTGWFWDFGDGSNSSLKNPTHTYNNIGYFNVSLKVFNDYSSSIIVKNRFVHVYWDNEILVNPDFEAGNKLVGWDYSAASIYSLKKYVNTGIRCVSIQEGGYISQLVQLDTVDFISFAYMSNQQGAIVNVLLDDKSLLNYTSNSWGMGNWEVVLLNLSNVSGFHTISFLQSKESGYIDSFDLIRNDDILVNFTLTSHTLVGDNLSLSFNDCSYGLIDGWLWDFGDGTTSTSQNVTYSFKTGHYTVSLTVYNENTTKTMYYNVPISLPTIERTNVEYSTVQSAIDNAVDGDIINVNNNIFYKEFIENIIIEKSLVLNFNDCLLISEDNLPIFQVNKGVKVIINNISLRHNNIFVTDDSSLLIIENSLIENSNIILAEGNILIRNTQFNNCYLTILNDNYSMDYCNVSVGGVIVSGGKSRITNSSFSGCDVAINQTGGELSLISNSIINNNIGVSVSGGISNVNFNEIHSNSRFGLIYSTDSVDYSNNWWGSNNPSYNCSLTIPEVYFDVFQISDASSGMYSWIVLNITKYDLDYHYWIRGVTYYNLTIDLGHNNLGEDISQFGGLPPKFYEFKFNNYEFEVYIENGFKEYLFSWGYLTSDVNEMNIQFINQNLSLKLDARQVTFNIVNETTYLVVNGKTYENTYSKWVANDTLKISYITPSTSFSDSMEVVIECNDPNAIIFYTLDGSDAGYSSTRNVYTGSFTINETTVVHYAALDSLGNFYMIEDSIIQVNDLSFTRNHCFILFSNIGKETGYNSIYYTLDGTNPVDSDSKITYTHPFFIEEMSNLRARWLYYLWTGTEYVLKSYAFRVYTYNYDFSTTYLKEVNSTSSGAVWGKYQGDNNNSGVTNYTGPLNNISKWSLENLISSGSAVVDREGHIFLSGDDGYLYCLNSQGLVIWRFGTTSKIICTPTIGGDGNIYFVNWLNSTLYCLSPEGQLIWKYILGDYNTGSSPVFGYDDILYVISGDDTYSTLFAFKDMKLLWSSKFPALIAHTPIIGDDGAVYLISKSNYLFGVNIDGSLKFGVYLTVSDEEAFNVISSNPAYLVLGSGYYASLSRDDEFIYIVDHYAVSAYYFNGTQAWHKRVSGASGTPTVYNGVLYVSGTSGLYALNASNGNQLWFKELKTTSLSLSSPLVSNDSVIYLSGNSTVYAVSLDGELLWSYNIPSKYGGAFSVSSPTLTDDGTLIVTTIQGIYAFNDIAAEFTYSHVSGTERTIQFTDLSTKGNNSYFWSFGDGYYSQEQNPQHMYAEPGKYRVELVVEHDGINLARNTTIEVISYDITPPVPVTAYIKNTKTKGGIFNQTQIVTLVSSDESGKYTIYYTVDGSNPVNSSTRRTYVEPLSIEVYTVLNAVALDESDNYAKVSTFTFNITDAINVNDKINTTLIQKIQELLDNAEPNSKFVFDYKELYGANFTINKPLKIITNVNTKLFGNNNQPVFTLTENATNSIINGFTIDNDNTDGILIQNTENISIINSIIQGENAVNVQDGKNIRINDCLIINSTNGIYVKSSDNTYINNVVIVNCTNNGIHIKDSINNIIQNSLLENNGVDPYYSEANNILLDNTLNNKIVNNVLNYGYFGLYFKNNNKNTLIDNNTIYEGIGDAIYLSGWFINLNITHNTLDGCFNGINFNGYSENVEVLNNLIQKMHYHKGEPESGREYNLFYNFNHKTDLYGQYNNAIQVFELASNFHNEVHIENNICILLEHRAWESRKTGTYIDANCGGYGYNLWDGSDSYHWLTSGATHYREGFVDLVLDRIGDSSYRLRLINQRTGEYLSDIPAFDVIFTAGRYTQTVKFINDSAIATFDVASSITTITAKISAEIKKSISWNIPISEGYSSSNRDNDPGYEAGEAINNPNPKSPSIADMIKRFSKNENTNQGNGNGHGHGQGTGTGNGQGSGNGHGSSGHGGSSINGREGDVRGDALNQVKTDTGNSPSIGVEAAAEGDSDSVEGGSEDNGETTLDSTTAYEIKKVINIKDNSLQFVLAVLFSVIILIGFAYRKRKDGGEM